MLKDLDLPEQRPAEWYGRINRECLSGSQLYYLDSTSGTTGSPKHRYVSLNDDRRDVAMLRRCLRTAALRPRDRVAVLDVGDLSLYSMFRKALPAGRGVYFGGVAPPFEHSAAKVLNACQPDVLFGFGSVLTRSASAIEKYARTGKLRSVIYTGDPLPDGVRRGFSSLNVDVRSLYSSIELGFAAMECRMHDGMHLWTDQIGIHLRNVSTVTRQIFRRSRETVVGDLAASTFWYEAKPAVVYRTGDVVYYTDTRCACGSPQPRIKLARRESDVVSLYGHKIAVDEVAAIVYKQPDLTNLVSLQIGERRSGVIDFVVVLPRERAYPLKERADGLVQRLQRYPGLAFLVDRSLIDIRVVFRPALAVAARKITRVRDPRASRRSI
jgi:phenylacetate-CoA ligase